MEQNGNAGCLCGHVRLRIGGEPATVIECHCTDCQKSTGGGAVLVVMMPRDSVELLEGTLGSFSVTGASGHEVKRCFCPECGTPVYSDLGKYPSMLAIKAGIWDVDQGFAPKSAIWTGSAPGWHQIPNGIPNLPGATG